MEGNDLERRLRAAEDRLAILELEGAYAKAFDARRGAEWAALFTEDGSYEGRERPGSGHQPQRLVRGRDALARFCDTVPFSGIHLMSLPHLTFDGDRATGRVHFTFHALYPEGATVPAQVTMVGYYDVAYVRTEEGGWLIQRRVTTPFTRARSDLSGYQPIGAFENP